LSMRFKETSIFGIVTVILAVIVQDLYLAVKIKTKENKKVQRVKSS